VAYEDQMQAKTLKELAAHVGGQIIGNPDVLIHSASTLARAGAGQISFLANEKYEKQLGTTAASAVIVKTQADIALDQIIAEDPYYAFMQIVVLLHGHRKHKAVGISPKASVADSAKLGVNCDVHDFATICDNAKLGSGCRIYPGAYVGEDVEMGDNCMLYANAVIYDGCKLGNGVIVNANSVVGEDGFGFATHEGKHHKIPQVGVVVIEDDVEIGVCCGIERGTLGDTVIGSGTKIGDSVTVGHGSKIGSNCLLVAQIGVAGSTTIGNNCIIGGQAGIVGHVTIGNNVTIAAKSGVINSVPDGMTLVGAPAIDAAKGRRAYSMIEYLPDMKQSIRRLEKQLAELKAANGQQAGSDGK